jgi:hypothetical protein
MGVGCGVCSPAFAEIRNHIIVDVIIFTEYARGMRLAMNMVTNC